MPSMFQDLRHGLRSLASHPGLTIAAALSLGYFPVKKSGAK